MPEKYCICHCLPPDRAGHKVNDLKASYNGDLGEGRSGTSRGLKPAGLCCSLTHSVQCGPNEPSCFLDPNLDPGMDAGL